MGLSRSAKRPAYGWRGVQGTVAVVAILAVGVGGELESGAEASVVAILGATGYAEYFPGTLPLVFASPHDGHLTPSSLPDRTRVTGASDSFAGHCHPSEAFVTSRDRNATVLMFETSDEIETLTGRRPHVVNARLHRKKLDPNRPIDLGAGANATARAAWREYHGFLDQAKNTILSAYGRGHYVDFHGSSYAFEPELSYAVTKTDLHLSDAELEALAIKPYSSVQALASRPGKSLAQVIRGPQSLGGLLETRGWRCSLGPRNPNVAGHNNYYCAGYSTMRHGSSVGNAFIEQPNRIDATHLEVQKLVSGALLDNATRRRAFAKALASALIQFMEQQYGFALTP
jgi:hypothetical protein